MYIGNILKFVHIFQLQSKESAPFAASTLTPGAEHWNPWITAPPGCHMHPCHSPISPSRFVSGLTGDLPSLCLLHNNTLLCPQILSCSVLGKLGS